mgnify:CR=1 FL=1|tara:strand:+ start:1600 stop:1842 length:243 start_codon:yes stop_codon:yes gene_type:complete
MGLGKKVFVRKSGANGADLYKWSPDEFTKKSVSSGVGKNYFCSTPIGSQGNDYIYTYSYIIVVVGSDLIRSAYFQCDYVK